ncbi:MAG: 50S ribosomal protein L11 methyltransferase [Anaerolineales bacterium]
MAEPAAELLGRLAPNGVALEGLDEQWDAVLLRAWLPVDGLLAGRQRELEEGLWHLGQIEPFPPPSFRSIGEQDWAEVWKREYQPLAIGRRLMVIPNWSAPDPGGRLVVRLEPGMAFGTGAHPTTRHCLEFIERDLRPGDAVLDLGCGSGVLAIAAARLGAGRVLALDTDPQAVELARLNVQRNAVDGQVKVALGSFPAGGAERIDPVELLVANLRSDTLIEMLQAGLAAWVRPAGRLLLSGLLETDLPKLRAAGQQAKLREVEVRATDDWRTVLFQRP